MPKSDLNKVAHFPLKATLLKSHLKPRLNAEKLCEESAVQLINKSTRNSCRCNISTVSSPYFVSVYLSIRKVTTLTTNAPHHTETSQLICNANQLTGFYIKGKIGR